MTISAPVAVSRFPMIEVAGSHREMGRQIGEATRESLRELVEVVTDRINVGRAGLRPISNEQALEVARTSTAYAAEYAPELMAEVEGVAEGAGLTVDQVMLVNVRNQVPAAIDGACTGVVVEPERAESETGMAGQNWDNDPAMDPFSIVLIRRPTGAPAHMNFTQPGIVGYMGLNDVGLGVVMNTLPAPARGLGVPWYFLVRRMYMHSSLKDVTGEVRRARRAISANVALLTSDGAADLEVTVDDVHVLRANGNGVLVHTNHCVHPELAHVNEQFPDLIQSTPRMLRAESLLENQAGGVGLEHVKSLLSDHLDYPTSICRHENDHPGDGHWTSVVSMIVEPSKGRMHLTRGNPCSNPYEVYSLN